MIKEWLEYRKNVKRIKRETAKYLVKVFDDNARLVEIATYIASLSKEDIEKILVSASVDSIKD